MSAPILLQDEERIFRDTILGYAKDAIAPRTQGMDESGALDLSIVPALFEMGLMSIEVPERFGGSGSRFFSAILAVEFLAEVDPSVSVFVDVQNTLVNNCLLRWANDAQQQTYLPRLSREWVGSYALSEPSSGSDAFALSCNSAGGPDGPGAGAIPASASREHAGAPGDLL